MAETLEEKITKAQAGLILSALDQLTSDATIDHEARVVSLEAPIDSAAAALRFEDASIPLAKLGTGAGVAALLAAGLGASQLYDHTTDVGTKTLLAADPADRAVVIVAVVTTAFGGTTKPLFKIGETSTVTKFKQIGEGQLPGTLGTVYVAAGTLTGTKDLLVTITDGVGGTPAGQLAVTALVLPVTA